MREENFHDWGQRRCLFRRAWRRPLQHRAIKYHRRGWAGERRSGGYKLCELLKALILCQWWCIRVLIIEYYNLFMIKRRWKTTKENKISNTFYYCLCYYYFYSRDYLKFCLSLSWHFFYFLLALPLRQIATLYLCLILHLLVWIMRCFIWRRIGPRSLTPFDWVNLSYFLQSRRLNSMALYLLTLSSILSILQMSTCS